MKAKYTIRQLLLAAIILCSEIAVCYGTIHDNIGAASFSAGRCSLTRPDLWSIINNQANLAFNRQFQIGFASEHRFMLKELAIQSFALGLPVKKGSLGVYFTRQGIPEFSENKAGLAYGMPLGEKVSAGICLHYSILLTQPSEYIQHSPGFDIGCLFQASPKFIAGIQLRSNFTDDRISQKRKVESLYTIGFAYAISDEASSMVEIYKSSWSRPGMRFGLDYKVLDYCTLRGGCQTHPFLLSFGIGFRIRRMVIDVGIGAYDKLWITPAISIIYLSREK